VEIPITFRDAFVNVSMTLKKLEVPDGCTCAAVFVKDDVCFVGGVGDSRVVRVTSQRAQRITTDAKPTNRDEYERLRANGLTINADSRIGRKLAVARAFGDFWMGQTIFVPPEIISFGIEDDDDALIIACDGVWDVIDDETAGNIVRKAVTAADAAVALKSFAYAMASKDNISVIVVKWHPGKGDGGLCARNTVEILPPVEEDAPDPAVATKAAPTGRRRR
jgi:serine/threonine protein phosphatase PrpC